MLVFGSMRIHIVPRHREIHIVLFSPDSLGETVETFTARSLPAGSNRLSGSGSTGVAGLCLMKGTYSTETVRKEH